MQVSPLLTHRIACRFRASKLVILSITGLVLCSSHASWAQTSDHVGQVLVRIHDLRGENALDQVHVQLLRFPEGIVSEGFTDSNGSVQFSGISTGAYTIRATRTGYQQGEARVDFRRGDATLLNVDIPLAPVDKDGGAPPGGIVSSQSLQVPEKALKEFQRGRVLLNERKNARESIPAFQRAIAAFPGYSAAYFLMGTAQMQLGAAAAAEAAFRKAITQEPRWTAPYYPLAMLLFAQKRFDEEQQLLFEAQKLDAADWRWSFELARCDAQQGRWENALRNALESGKNANAPPKIHLLLADIYSNSGRVQEAISELELFARLDPASPYIARVQEVLTALRKKAPAASASQP